jgi:hypothetical protein
MRRMRTPRSLNDPTCRITEQHLENERKKSQR